MDWSYFYNEKGKFRAKRLPSPKGATVRFKDDTDLDQLRDYLSDCISNEESIEAYKHCFDNPIDYEVEMDSFEEVVARNPLGKRRASAGYHESELSVFAELNGWESSGTEWMLLDPVLGAGLEKAGLVERKTSLDARDWARHLEQQTVAELKALAAKLNVEVRGKKLDIVTTLAEALASGSARIKPPFFAQPTESLTPWFEDLQQSYLDDIEKSLASWGYPATFKAAVWSTAIDYNEEWPSIVQTIRERHGALLKCFEASAESPGSMSDSVTVKVTYDDGSTSMTPAKRGRSVVVWVIVAVAVLVGAVWIL